MEYPPLAVVIPAGGLSTRFGSNKLLADLTGQSVFERTIQSFVDLAFVKQTVVPIGDSGSLSVVRRESGPPLRTCNAGANRAESVRNGLLAIDESFEWVAIHDAARPLVSQALIERVFDAALRRGCAAPALPVSLTIKQATGPLPAHVEKTVPRRHLWAMQTPQIMRRDALLDAYRRCQIDLNDVTDDVQLMELAGHDVWLVPGDERNIKITTPLDLIVAKAILSER